MLVEVNVGDSVKAVAQLGIWVKIKVVHKANNAVVINVSSVESQMVNILCGHKFNSYGLPR